MQEAHIVISVDPLNHLQQGHHVHDEYLMNYDDDHDYHEHLVHDVRGDHDGVG